MSRRSHKSRSPHQVDAMREPIEIELLILRYLERHTTATDAEMQRKLCLKPAVELWHREYLSESGLIARTSEHNGVPVFILTLKDRARKSRRV